MAELSEVPGAVVDDAGLRHIGSPLAEQRRLVSGGALAPLGDRRVLSVTGPDRLSWLDSLSSQALTHLPAASPPRCSSSIRTDASNTPPP